MTITYRTAGAWGAGKGSNLTPAEVDGNFYTLLTRIVDIEENPPSAASISDITMDGTQITFHLSDGSEYGPFDVPVAAFSWTGDWVAGTSYEPFDVFVVVGDGQYLVIGAYEAPTDDFDGSDVNLVKMFDVANPNSVTVLNAETATDGDFLITPDHAGRYLRFGEATQVVLPSTLEDSAFELGSVITIYCATAELVSVTAPMGVTLNTAETTILRKQGSSASLVKVGTAEWDLVGDLQQA